MGAACERARAWAKPKVAFAWCYLTQSVFKVVLLKSIPTKIRQLVLYVSNCKEYVDGFVGELTSANDFKNTIWELRCADELGVGEKDVFGEVQLDLVRAVLPSEMGTSQLTFT